MIKVESNSYREILMQLGVGPGDEVSLENWGNQQVIIASRKVLGLCQEGNVLVHHSKVQDKEAETGLAKQRGERLEQLAEGLPR